MDLISHEYKELLREHRRRVEWGPGNPAHFKLVDQHLLQNGCQTILDYGCGEGGLLMEMLSRRIKAVGYDPAVERYSILPDGRYDGVVCMDVLEHIEPAFLDNVLEHLLSVTGKLAYLVIHLGKAIHVLPNGDNAHLIVKPYTWWLGKLSDTGFELVKTVGVSRHHLQVLVKPNGGK